MSVRVNFVLRPRVPSEEEWGCSRNSVRVTHPPVFRQRFKGLNASASTPAMRVELISQDRAQSRMHVGAGSNKEMFAQARSRLPCTRSSARSRSRQSKIAKTLSFGIDASMRW